MPMDGVTLCLVARELDGLLSGGRVDKISQPERDEVILTIRNGGENRLLLLSANPASARAHITREKKANPLEPPNLCMLMRKHLLGARIARIRQAESDRILEIVFEHTDELGDRARKTLVCEFMGKHSNLILVSENGRIMESARRVNEFISSFREVLPGVEYRRPPAHGKIPFDRIDEERLAERLGEIGGYLARALTFSVSGLSAPLSRELAYRAAGSEDALVADAPAGILAKNVRKEMDDLLSSPSARVLLNDGGAPVDLLAFAYRSRAGQPEREYPSVSEAIDDFYRLRDREERINQKSAAIRRTLVNNMERLEKKIALQTEAAETGARAEEFRIKGEMLSASAHLVRKGMKTVSVPNYYSESGAEIEVALDEKLSAMANAQRYFKLYKKALGARRLAEEQKRKSLEELAYLEGQMDNLQKCADERDLADIREELVHFGYIRDALSRRQTKALPASSPLRFTSADGTEILVGKNNVQNDRLTFSAQSDEWWLHVKDMPGSHVIVKSESPSEATLLEAANLAAKYSKGSASSGVPVDMTRRRYVKKPGGARPGFVIYTHQKTVYVTPK